MQWRLRVLPSFTVLLVLATALTSAQEKKTGNGPARYYPLQVGNQWTFKVTVGENSAVAISRIAKVENFDGTDLHRLEASVNGNIVATEHLRETADGVFRHRNNGAEITPAICLLKYPVTIPSGQSVKWDGNVKVGADQGKYSCEAKEETVEVPAGKFKTIRVSIRLDGGKGQTVNTTYWFVQDIGFVRQTVDAAGLSIIMELEKFERGK